MYVYVIIFGLLNVISDFIKSLDLIPFPLPVNIFVSFIPPRRIHTTRQQPPPFIQLDMCIDTKCGLLLCVRDVYNTGIYIQMCDGNII